MLPKSGREENDEGWLDTSTLIPTLASTSRGDVWLTPLSGNAPEGMATSIGSLDLRTARHIAQATPPRTSARKSSIAIESTTLEKSLKTKD